MIQRLRVSNIRMLATEWGLYTHLCAAAHTGSACAKVLLALNARLLSNVAWPLLPQSPAALQRAKKRCRLLREAIMAILKSALFFSFVQSMSASSFVAEENN